MNRMLSDGEEQVISARYAKGESLDEIHADYKTISRSTIFNALRRNGISFRSRRAFTDAEEQIIIARYINGESTREICKSYPFSHDAITAVLSRNGVKRHSHRGADITGRVYGCLTVMGFHSILTSKNNHKRVVWLCRCVCGNEILAQRYRLVSGDRQSCGCAQIKHLRTDPRQSNINGVIKVIKHTAMTRGLVFDLTIAQTVGLLESNCHYCGIKPSAVHKTQNKNHPFVRNGIDRVDSEIGYIESNVVPCCFICNRAKSNLSYNEFISWADNISNHRLGLLRKPVVV